MFPRPQASLLFLAAVSLGWLAGQSEHGIARAAATKDAVQLQCRTFKHSLDVETVIETSDRTSEVGQWVSQARADGWSIKTIDFEVAQNPNGFPQGFVQVCLER